MKIFDSLEELEYDEERLRQKVNTLPEDLRRQFFNQQLKQLKDPDTYAVLNWLFLGGIHHLYLKKYYFFIIEITLLIISVIALSFGFISTSVIILCVMIIYELPQLFFAQKIARQYNHKVSMQLFDSITKEYVS